MKDASLCDTVLLIIGISQQRNKFWGELSGHLIVTDIEDGMVEAHSASPAVPFHKAGSYCSSRNCTRQLIAS